MKSLEYYRKYAKLLVDKDVDRDRDYIKYDKQYHCDWSLPADLAAITWVRKSTNTEIHDAINAGTRTLSALEPKITFQPYVANEKNKERANQVERVLAWQLWCANRRRQAPIQRDFMKSAMLYDEICAQVIDIEWQIKQAEAIGLSVNWLKAAKRYSRFMVNTYNPRFVHTRYSNVMPEVVLLAHIKSAADVVSEFGEKAKSLFALARDDSEIKHVALFDLWDLETRVVWAVEAPHGVMDGNSFDSKSGLYVIQEPEEHGLPFLPWVCRVGGSTMEVEEERKRHPIGYSTLKSGQWETLNILLSLSDSKTIAMHGQATIAEEGPMPATSTNVDYDDPMMPMKVTPGNTVKQLSPAQIDPKVFDMKNDYRSQIRKSTVAGVLQNPETTPGEAFASINLRTQIATGALIPYKELAEYSLADVLERFMLWVHYTDKPLTGFGREGKYNGEEYVINADEIDPESLYLKVQLMPDTPTDKIGKINAASIAVQTLGMSKEFGLEEIGITDPQQEMEKAKFEELVQFETDLYKQEKMAMMQMQIQQMQMEMQMMAQQQTQQQAMLQNSQGMMGPQGVPGAEGQGFNPAAGGMPPAQMMPEATREMQGGYDRTGNPIAAGVV